MAEVTVTCPMCGMDIHGPDEDGLSKNYKEHAHDAHAMETSHEEAKQAVKIWLEE
jgi:predicted small metal-binding protein